MQRKTNFCMFRKWIGTRRSPSRLKFSSPSWDRSTWNLRCSRTCGSHLPAIRFQKVRLHLLFAADSLCNALRGKHVYYAYLITILPLHILCTSSLLNSFSIVQLPEAISGLGLTNIFQFFSKLIIHFQFIFVWTKTLPRL